MIGYVYNYLFNRELGFVERWHAWPTHRKESVAEHSYFVARNALFIARLLKQYKIANPDQSKVLEIALLHDEPEIHTGDISGITKREHPELKELLDNIEKDLIINKMYAGFGSMAKRYQDMALMSQDKYYLESQIVKYADLLDAHIFITSEWNLGNGYMAEHLQKSNSYMQNLDWPWLDTLREETGLP